MKQTPGIENIRIELGRGLNLDFTNAVFFNADGARAISHVKRMAAYEAHKGSPLYGIGCLELAKHELAMTLRSVFEGMLPKLKQWRGNRTVGKAG